MRKNSCEVVLRVVRVEVVKAGEMGGDSTCDVGWEGLVRVGASGRVARVVVRVVGVR